jgi:hypothetical protein
MPAPDLVCPIVNVMRFRLAVIGLCSILVSHTGLMGVASSPPNMAAVQSVSVSRPLPPEYVIKPDGSVRLRICFNWSCADIQTLTFTPNDMAQLKKHMARCPGTGLHDRLQRVRIGIWQMELLAQKYQPLLANDLAINDFEANVDGRMDCIDNAGNTTTYLHILRDLRELSGWTVAPPKVRRLFDITAVHWTAVIIDTDTGRPLERRLLVSPERSSADGHAFVELDGQKECLGAAFRTSERHSALDRRALSSGFAHPSGHHQWAFSWLTRLARRFDARFSVARI